MPALPEEIDAYMAALEFVKEGDWTYSNGKITLADVKPSNVLKDSEGNLYVIDAEISKTNTR